MSGDIWYSVGPRDVSLPETFGPFLLELSSWRCATSSCAITPTCWRPSSGAGHQSRIRDGHFLDVFLTGCSRFPCWRRLDTQRFEILPIASRLKGQITSIHFPGDKPCIRIL